MQIEPTKPTILNPEAQFPGNVWLDLIATPHTDDQRTTVGKVRFAPGARTAWHHHARGQYLYVTEGVARFGTRDGKVVDVQPGKTLYVAPGEEHFHAAADDSFMEHIAIIESADDPTKTTVWLEQITDEDYAGK
jgi:quercetin dioxygenase-like cupin family protein